MELKTKTMKKQKTDYKWIDLKRERETTENPIWWLKGCLIIAVWFLALLVIQHWL